MNKYATALRYGIIGALMTAVYGVLTYIFYRSLFSSFFIQMIFGLAYFASIIFIVVWGVISHKREQGSVKFPDAFIAGMIIYTLTIVSSNFVSYIIPHYIDTDYPQQLYELVKRSTADSMEKFGAPDEEIEKALDRIKMDQFNPDLLSTLKGLGISIAVGAVLCLIVAAFASRRDPVKSELQTNTPE